MCTGFLCLLAFLYVTKSQSTEDRNSVDSSATSEEVRLLTDILQSHDSYKKLARPVRNVSDTLIVHFGISLVQILDFDEKNQLLTVLIWKRMQWVDELIPHWNPQDYGGADQIVIPHDSIWTPDIVLYQNAGEPKLGKYSSHLVVSPAGTINWVPPVKYHVSCSLKMHDFPFDIQTCKLTFGSWTHDQKRLNPVFYEDKQKIILDEYIENSEWKMIDNYGIRNVWKDSCCENNYTALTFVIQLKRKVTLHINLILIPTVLLSVMSVFIFWIPPSRPDRTGIGLSLFSAFLLLLILVVNSSPATDDAKLGQYYIVIILMVCAGIMISVVSINIIQLTRNMPKCIEKVFVQVLANILFLTKNKKNRKPINDNLVQNSLTEQNSKDQTGQLVPAPQTEEEIQSSNSEKWKIFALVLDRIFFVIFCVALVLSFCFIFPKPLQLFAL